MDGNSMNHQTEHQLASAMAVLAIEEQRLEGHHNEFMSAHYNVTIPMYIMTILQRRGYQENN